MLSTQHAILITRWGDTVFKDTRGSRICSLCCFHWQTKHHVCQLPLPGRRRRRLLLLLLLQVALMRWECRELRHGDDTWARPARRGDGRRHCGSIRCSGRSPGSGTAFLPRRFGGTHAINTGQSLARLCPAQDTTRFPWPDPGWSRGINLRQLRVRCHARKSRCSKP